MHIVHTYKVPRSGEVGRAPGGDVHPYVCGVTDAGAEGPSCFFVNGRIVLVEKEFFFGVDLISS